MWIKICGIRNPEEARWAIEAGADALGFLVGLDYPSADALELDSALALAGAFAGTGVERVLVTHRVDAVWVAEALDGRGFDAVQLHGDFPLEAIGALRDGRPWLRIARVVHVTGEAAIERAARVARVADIVHLDTRSGDRIGGTGLPHDWSISARIVAAVAPRPVVLAGGLTPENVADAIARVRPWGVDVNTGVEDALGAKARNRIGTFIESARHPARGGPSSRRG